MAVQFHLRSTARLIRGYRTILRIAKPGVVLYSDGEIDFHQSQIDNSDRYRRSSIPSIDSRLDDE